MPPLREGREGDGPERLRLEALRQLGGLRPGWFYVGRRPRATEVFVVSAATVERLEHRAYRSRTAFDWGPESDWTGRLELSYALLADLTARRPPDAAIFSLFSRLVERLSHDGFLISDVDLETWLALDERNPLRWSPSRQPDGR